MKIAYLDCSSGISGDMFLGALIDAGVPLIYIKDNLKSLHIKNYSLQKRKVKRAGISAIKFNVRIDETSTVARKWSDVEKIITNSELNENIKKNGLNIFENLFTAEAKIHNKEFNNTHLHELGAVDCLIDIIGSILGIDYLGLEKINISPINLGSGNVRSSHGILPVPAPATIELLKGIPVYSSDIKTELTTPTGAAIIKGIATGFGNLPEIVVDTVGYGAGNKDLKTQPNVLRLFIGESLESPQHKDVTIIETNIDDMSPQIYEYLMERLLKSGARDVYLTPVIMKKGRPANKLTVIADSNKREVLSEIIFSETTTIGLRYHEMSRETIKREIKKINTEYGEVKIKIASKNNKIINVSPEYEDCRKIAKKYTLPLKKVIADVTKHIQLK